MFLDHTSTSYFVARIENTEKNPGSQKYTLVKLVHPDGDCSDLPRDETASVI